MSKVYNRTGSVMPGRSVFDLSYDKKMTADMGYLYPVMCDEVVPGDKFEIGNEIVIRFQPLVAPVLHEINAYVHYYFVPYRLLDDNWEDFITEALTAIRSPYFRVGTRPPMVGKPLGLFGLSGGGKADRTPSA